AAIREVRRRSWPCGESLRGWMFCVAGDVQRYDADCIGIVLVFQLSCGGVLVFVAAPFAFVLAAVLLGAMSASPGSLCPASRVDARSSGFFPICRHVSTESCAGHQYSLVTVRPIIRHVTPINCLDG